MKAKALLVVTNMWIYFEELSVIRQLGYTIEDFDVSILIDKKYNQYPVIRMQLSKDIKAITPSAEFVEQREIESSEFYLKLAPTFLHEQTMALFNSVNANQSYLVEEGISDYTDGVPRQREACVFLTDAQKAVNTGGYYCVDPLIPDLRLLDSFVHYYELQDQAVFNLPVTTPILFTTPLERDFGIKGVLEKTKDALGDLCSVPIIIKPHPRDNTVWDFGSICLSTCPGQILNMLFCGNKYYMYESTVGMNDRNKIVFEIV